MKRLPITGGFGVLYLAVFMIFTASGCGGYSGKPPIEKIKQTLSNAPTYSIVLENMKSEGNFIKSYYHKYRVIQGDDKWTTDWLQVPEDYYKTNEGFLGMCLFTRKEGVGSSQVTPPGYAYVGDQRYGRWRSDYRGNSFWEFYGKYAFFSSLFGSWYHPIYRNDYSAFGRYRSRRAPFFGRNNEYGSSGSIARTTRPNFFSRYMNRKRSARSIFSSKVNRRIGRTRTGFRGRAGGFGK